MAYKHTSLSELISPDQVFAFSFLMKTHNSDGGQKTQQTARTPYTMVSLVTRRASRQPTEVAIASKKLFNSTKYQTQ
jgi:hypothetical protein